MEISWLDLNLLTNSTDRSRKVFSLDTNPDEKHGVNSLKHQKSDALKGHAGEVEKELSIDISWSVVFHLNHRIQSLQETPLNHMERSMQRSK